MTVRKRPFVDISESDRDCRHVGRGAEKELQNQTSGAQPAPQTQRDPAA